MAAGKKEIKCLVWDLDNTMWDGILVEGDDVRLREGVREVIEALDGRGILHSIASRNEPDIVMEQIRELGLDKYFLHPQISWGPKSEAVASVIETLNIGANTVAFIDDDPFERDEVAAALPEVLCIDASDLHRVPAMPRFNPKFVTNDSRRRRSMYQAEIERKKVESVIPADEFLKYLGMVFTISEAAEGDLDRIDELTARTSQLNSTGYTYTLDQLDRFRRSDRHELIVASLDDRYGTYGKIGVALIETDRNPWMLKLLLMSCRVMARGVGMVMLSHILQRARAAKTPVRAEFIRTDRNRMMYLTFKISGFKEIDRRGEVAVLEHDLETIDPFPNHVDVRIVEPPKMSR
jgi:FkbH-like protein